MLGNVATPDGLAKADPSIAAQKRQHVDKRFMGQSILKVRQWQRNVAPKAGKTTERGFESLWACCLCLKHINFAPRWKFFAPRWQKFCEALLASISGANNWDMRPATRKCQEPAIVVSARPMSGVGNRQPWVQTLQCKVGSCVFLRLSWARNLRSYLAACQSLLAARGF